MIHVTIYENDRKECIGFQTKGHAEYAKMGQDIVCAAVSVLVINTMNAIEDVYKRQIEGPQPSEASVFP